MLDMGRRLRSVEVMVVGVFAALAGVVAPTTGWAPIGAAALALACFALLTALTRHTHRPEYAALALIVVVQLTFAIGIVGSAGPRILFLALFAVPAVMAGAVWPPRGVALVTATSALLMVGVGFVVDTRAVLITPPLVIYPIAVLVSTVVVAYAAQGADVSSRASAVVDRLTGLLNRAALLSRAAEVGHQAALTGAPVAVLVGDLDRFKDVNDRYGHARGDTVLVAVASRLRDAAAPGELVYRFGGEEFVVLIPDADGAAGATSAERFRGALARELVDGLQITISFGVAACARREPFDFEAAFSAADGALYAAKAQGRDRVCTSDVLAAPLWRADRQRPRMPSAAEDDSSGTWGRHRTEESAGGARGPRRGEQLHRSRDTATLAEHIAREKAATGSWLVPDEAARAHMLDLLHRIRSVRLIAYGVVFLALLSAGPFYGWLPVVPPLAAAAVMAVVIERSGGLRRPEFAIGAAIVLSLVANAVGFALAHGKPYVAIPMLVVPVFAWSPVFPARGVAVAAVIDAGLIVGVGALIGSGAFANPIILGVPLAFLAAAALIGSVLGRSSIDHRSAAIVDQLTGLLTRQALASRVAEISNRVEHSGAPVAVIAADIDHFKRVNDRLGHRTGDAVLGEVSYRIRSNLRAFESAYRVGGEEFVVLLPGLDAAQAAEIAGRLRAAISEQPAHGVSVTVSFGVAATQPGEPFDYATLFAHADASLYEAKRGGRDIVRVARPATVRVAGRGEAALAA